MLLRSKTLPDWRGDPVTTDDPQEHLLAAAQKLGLVHYNGHSLDSWKYNVQGIGNWLLRGLLMGTSAFAIILLAAVLVLHWSLPQFATFALGLIVLVGAEVWLLGTRWHTVYFGPEDSKAPKLTPDLQAIVSGMTLQWQNSGRQWPLGFAAEFLMQPFWRRRKVCIFQIHGVSKDSRLVVALRPED